MAVSIRQFSIIVIASVVICADLATSRSFEDLRELFPNQTPPKTTGPSSSTGQPAVEKSKVRFDFGQTVDNSEVTHQSSAKSAEQIRMEYLYRQLASGHRRSFPTPSTCHATSYRSRALSFSNQQGSLCTSFSWQLPEESGSRICFAEMWFSIHYFRDLILQSSDTDLLHQPARLQIVTDTYETRVANLRVTWSNITSSKWIVVDTSEEVREKASASNAMICVRNAGYVSASEATLRASVGMLNRHKHHQVSDESPFAVGGVNKEGSDVSLGEFIRDHSAKLRRGLVQLRGAGRRRRSVDPTTPPYPSHIPENVEYVTGEPEVAPIDKCQRNSMLLHLPDYLDSVEVLRPKNVDIFDCLGSCPYGDPITPHAFFMQMVRVNEELSGKSLSHSCCIPSEFETEKITIAARYVYTTNETKVFDITNFVVVNCACS